MIDVAAEIDQYLERLFPLCRSLTGEPNRESLRVIQEIVPLEIHEVPSGTAVYDWVVPDEWTVRDAWVADKSGQRIIDFNSNNLHLVNYSTPIHKTMLWGELKSHVHKHPKLPNAIPYRTSYYQRNWGFCVTDAQYQQLANDTEALTVLIDTDLKKGSLSYGEYLLPGDSKQEILISCYICHPSMANDSLSGVLLTAFLARQLTRAKLRKWSYRFIFVPETIGAIAYCARNEAAMKAIDIGLVITTVGGPGSFGYKQSFEQMHPINRIIESVLSETGKGFLTYPFDIHGSDERQYSSQGIGINAATICKDRYYEYKEYHSSLDNLDFTNGRQIKDSLDIYLELIKRLEVRRIYRNKIPSCEVMLSKHNLYPTKGGHQLPEMNERSEIDLLLWVIFLCNGRNSIDDIAHKLKVHSSCLYPIVSHLEQKGVLEHV